MGTLSPAQKPRPGYAAQNSTQDDGEAIPNSDERQRIVRTMQRVHAGANARLTIATTNAAANTTSPSATDTRRSPPGRAILVRFANDTPMLAPAKAYFTARKIQVGGAERSVRMPRNSIIIASAISAPSPAEIRIILGG